MKEEDRKMAEQSGRSVTLQLNSTTKKHHAVNIEVRKCSETAFRIQLVYVGVRLLNQILSTEVVKLQELTCL